MKRRLRHHELYSRSLAMPVPVSVEDATHDSQNCNGADLQEPLAYKFDRINPEEATVVIRRSQPSYRASGSFVNSNESQFGSHLHENCGFGVDRFLQTAHNGPLAGAAGKPEEASPLPPTPPPRAKSIHSGTPLTLFTGGWLPHNQASVADMLAGPLMGKDGLVSGPVHTFTQLANSHMGLLASVYKRFRLTFWIDRLLLITGVLLPVVVGLLLVVIHAFRGVSRCLPERAGQHGQQASLPHNRYIDEACGLQLSFNVLQGTADSALANLNSMAARYTQASLQHECYPFVLLIIALFMWTPHYLWLKSIEASARRDLCFVRGELHSFRESLAREIAPNPSANTVTTHDTRNINSTSQAAQTAGTNCHLYHSMGTHGRLGGATLSSYAGPAPPPQPTHGGLLSPTPLQSKMNGADFSAPGLSELPFLQACQTDWSLNTYLANWQNSEFYWRRYLTKHVTLGLFQVINIVSVIVVVIKNRGAPFAALFRCSLQLQEASRQPSNFVCMLQSTFLANMSVLTLGTLSVVGLVCQLAFFHNNFWRSASVIVTNRRARMVRRQCPGSTPALLEMEDCYDCFFGDYIRLLAYAAFRDPHKEVRSLTVTMSPSIFCTDFHLVSLMCLENLSLFPDALHIHFWMERYARCVRRRQSPPYWLAGQRGTVGQIVRCEDLSVKFNFSKIRVKLEVCDL